MCEIQYRAANQLLSVTAEQRTQRGVDPHHTQLRRKRHHPDRDIVEITPKAPAEAACRSPGNA
jgi:hypothetical protein